MLIQILKDVRLMYKFCLGGCWRVWNHPVVERFNVRLPVLGELKYNTCQVAGISHSQHILLGMPNSNLQFIGEWWTRKRLSTISALCFRSNPAMSYFLVMSRILRGKKRKKYGAWWGGVEFGESQFGEQSNALHNVPAPWINHKDLLVNPSEAIHCC